MGQVFYSSVHGLYSDLYSSMAMPYHEQQVVCFHQNIQGELKRNANNVAHCFHHTLTLAATKNAWVVHNSVMNYSIGFSLMSRLQSLVKKWNAADNVDSAPFAFLLIAIVHAEALNRAHDLTLSSRSLLFNFNGRVGAANGLGEGALNSGAEQCFRIHNWNTIHAAAASMNTMRKQESLSGPEYLACR